MSHSVNTRALRDCPDMMSASEGGGAGGSWKSKVGCVTFVVQISSNYGQGGVKEFENFVDVIKGCSLISRAEIAQPELARVLYLLYVLSRTEFTQSKEYYHNTIIPSLISREGFACYDMCRSRSSQEYYTLSNLESRCHPCRSTARELSWKHLQ